MIMTLQNYSHFVPNRGTSERKDEKKAIFFQSLPSAETIRRRQIVVQVREKMKKSFFFIFSERRNDSTKLNRGIYNAEEEHGYAS